MTTTTARDSVQLASTQPHGPLDESRGIRLAAVAGLAFVALSVGSTFAPGTPPASDASAAKVASYFRDHAGGIKAQLLLGGLGIAALLWWFGALWRIMSRAEGERPRLAIVAAGSLVTGVALALVSGVITSTAAIRSDTVATTHLLYSFSLVAIAASGFGIAAFLVAACAITYRANVTPRWITYLGWLAALAFLAGTLGTVSDSSAASVFGLVAFLVWCVWIVAVSVVMWRSAES